MPVVISKPLPKLSDIQTIVPVHEQTWLRVIERFDVMDESGKECVAKEWYSVVLRVLAFGMVAIPGREPRHAYLTIDTSENSPYLRDGPYWHLSPASEDRDILVEVYFGEIPDVTKPPKSFCDGYTYHDYDSEADEGAYPMLYCVLD